MAQGVRGVARLLERTQHQVRQDALLGLPHDFANEALIMLRRDAQFAAGQRDAHGALTAVAIRIGPARLRRRRRAGPIRMATAVSAPCASRCPAANCASRRSIISASFAKSWGSP